MKAKTKEQFKNDIMLAVVFILFAFLGAWFLFLKGPREELSLEKEKLTTLESVEKDKQIQVNPTPETNQASRRANLKASSEMIQNTALRSSRKLGTIAAISSKGDEHSITVNGNPLVSAKFVNDFAGRIRFQNDGQISNQNNQAFIIVKSLNITPEKVSLVVSGR